MANKQLGIRVPNDIKNTLKENYDTKKLLSLLAVWTELFYGKENADATLAQMVEKAMKPEKRIARG